VEKDRTAARHLERARLLVRRAGERAFLVAEQLVLENFLGKGRAIEGEERPFGALALRVHGTRDQLLAGARFAEDQHARVRRRHRVDHLVDAAHRFRLSGQLAVMRQPLELGRELEVLFLEPELLEQFWDLCFELVQPLGVERLLDVVGGALLDRLDRQLGRSLAGDHDELGRDLGAPQLAEQRDPVELRHLEVGQHDAVALGAQPLERLLSVVCDVDGVAFVLEDSAETRGDRLFVVGDQHLRLVLLHNAVPSFVPRGKLIERALGSADTPMPASDAAANTSAGSANRAPSQLSTRKADPPSSVARQRTRVDASSAARRLAPIRRRVAAPSAVVKPNASTDGSTTSERPSTLAAAPSNASNRRVTDPISTGPRGARASDNNASLIAITCVS